MAITLITGGARSGKSRLALARASFTKAAKAFVATAEASDDEMKHRIERHKADRGAEWDTFEEPLNISTVLKALESRYPVIIIDCLTLWLANLMLSNADVGRETEEFVKVLSSFDPGSLVYIVSNEVGMGIVPENETARKFRDHAGFLNQQIALVADEVYLAVSGIPLKIKGEK